MDIASRHLSMPAHHREEQCGDRFGREKHLYKAVALAPGDRDGHVMKRSYTQPVVGTNWVGEMTNQPLSNPVVQSLSDLFHQLAQTLASFLKGFMPGASVAQNVSEKPVVVVDGKSEIKAHKSVMGQVLETAKATITPEDQRLYQFLDGRHPRTAEERRAVEKFAVIERQLEKYLTMDPTEFTAQTVPVETEDLETILTHEGLPTRREMDVIEKMHEGQEMTLEEQIISIKLNMLGC